jgi:hypothetical protein
VPAVSDPIRNGQVPTRHAFRSVGPVGTVRVGVLVATALLLAACHGTVACDPSCAGAPVELSIVGVGPDPARVLQVCVGGEVPCDQLVIAPAADPSTSPGPYTRYPCSVSDPHTDCVADGDTATVYFPGLASKELDGRRVTVTATGGHSADERGTGVFQFHQAHETCDCEYSYAQVHMSATS